MYSIKDYGSMIADDVRADAYLKAIRQAVKPGSVVLDIGTGTGFFALLACRFGARKVYAVDSSDIIEVARELAARNHCAGSIEFIQAMSTDISLPEQADVIVSDMRGVLPFFQNHLPAIVDARRRLLAPGGVLIPRFDSLWLSCVEAPDLHRCITTPWSDNRYGLDMRVAGDLQSNQWRKVIVKPEQMMTRPECFGGIDYATVVNPNFDSDVHVTTTRSGTGHGLCIWFDAALAEGVHFSNSPEKPSLIYGHGFFPWPEPVMLNAGDTITVALKSNLIGNEYLWTWETHISGKSTWDTADIRFKQSEFFGAPISLGKLQKQSAGHFPVLNEEGQIDGLILTMMRDGTTLGDIAKKLMPLFPNKFSRWQDALSRVAKLSVTYSS